MTGKAGFEQLSIILCADQGEDADTAAISNGLGAEIARDFGPPEGAPLSVRAYEGGALIGGLNGLIHWRWFYVRHFWITERWRGKQLGRRLLARAEAETRDKGGVGIYLDTFDPGAAAFYERCGFERFGIIENFPPGHARAFFRKKLSAAGD